ncbi:hypothetical protein I5L21_01455 [Serratia liquefaciens]|uniref:hypothetical protein n=1 Tax=Serratia liquefaciens TaxID=614 RepID=UPI0018D8EA63|nr:hypothetical protein [Serratia liquefaciens]MBH2809244.1 hypothetical protein [Serratia liquefaciens]
MVKNALCILVAVFALYNANKAIIWIKGLASGESKLCHAPNDKDPFKMVDCSSIEPKG